MYGLTSISPVNDWILTVMERTVTDVVNELAMIRNVDEGQNARMVSVFIVNCRASSTCLHAVPRTTLATLTGSPTCPW